MQHLEIGEFSTVFELTKNGKIHRPLRLRLYFLATLSVFLLGIVIRDVVRYDLDWGLALGFACAFFLVGVFILTPIFEPIEWNNQKEVMKLGRTNMFGVALIIIYIIFRLATKQYMESHYKLNTISGLTYASIFGMMMGRFIGTLGRIHRVHTNLLKTGTKRAKIKSP